MAQDVARRLQLSHEVAEPLDLCCQHVRKEHLVLPVDDVAQLVEPNVVDGVLATTLVPALPLLFTSFGSRRCCAPSLSFLIAVACETKTYLRDRSNRSSQSISHGV